METRCVLARENRGSFLAVYVAKVRITVRVDGTTIVREGQGSGEGRGTFAGEVHDIALKAAETDATKRALVTFGKPSGLELYRKDKKGFLEHSPTLQPATAVSPPQPRAGLHPDDTTPIPRPSHYYRRRHEGSMTKILRRDQAKTREDNAAAAPLAPAGSDSVSGQNRQEPARHCRAEAPARQGAPEICCLPTLRGLRPATVRSPPPAVRATASHRSQGK